MYESVNVKQNKNIKKLNYIHTPLRHITNKIHTQRNSIAIHV